MIRTELARPARAACMTGHRSERTKPAKVEIVPPTKYQVPGSGQCPVRAIPPARRPRQTNDSLFRQTSRITLLRAATLPGIARDVVVEDEPPTLEVLSAFDHNKMEYGEPAGWPCIRA
jgi:hypothetical protein